MFSVCTNSFVSFIEHFSRGVFAEPTLSKGCQVGGGVSGNEL